MAKKIKELTTATIPLTGGELLEMSQSDVSVKATLEEVRDFINPMEILGLLETDQPPEPAEDTAIIFLSNGDMSGTAAGDVVIASNHDSGEGAETTYTILHDWSSGTSWPGGE